MTVDLLTRYDHLKVLHQKTLDRIAALKRSLSEEQGKQKRYWKELKQVRAELDRRLADVEASEAPSQAPQADVPVESPAPEEKPVPASLGHRPSIRETVRAIPRDGEIGTAELRETLGLSEGATYTRIQKAKRAGLVESAGWGKYKLTEEGKKLHGPVLKAVPGPNGK